MSVGGGDFVDVWMDVSLGVWWWVNVWMDMSILGRWLGGYVD